MSFIDSALVKQKFNVVMLLYAYVFKNNIDSLLTALFYM